MMAPTVVLARRRRRGRARLGRLEPHPLGDPPDDRSTWSTADWRRRHAVDAPRLHFEGGAVDAEPGVDPEALDWLERHGWTVQRWRERNLYFGGVQAVARDRAGTLSGGGDPRRGGAVESVEG